MTIPIAMLVILAVQLGVRRRGTLPRVTHARSAGHDGTHGNSVALCLV